MFASNPITALKIYGESTPAVYKVPPSNEQQTAGVRPLDSLPAQWWNWIFNVLTAQENNTYRAVTVLMEELNNVLSAANITPSDAANNQLVLAINKLRQTIATATQPGAIKSGGDITVDEEGNVSVNASRDIGNLADLSTVLKDNIVTAINEVVSNIGSLANLQTVNKDTIVGAINEVLDKIPDDFGNGVHVYTVKVNASDTLIPWADLGLTDQNWSAWAQFTEKQQQYLDIQTFVDTDGVHLYPRRLVNGQIIGGTPLIPGLWGENTWGDTVWGDDEPEELDVHLQLCKITA